MGERDQAEVEDDGLARGKEQGREGWAGCEDGPEETAPSVWCTPELSQADRDAGNPKVFVSKCWPIIVVKIFLRSRS